MTGNYLSCRASVIAYYGRPRRLSSNRPAIELSVTGQSDYDMNRHKVLVVGVGSIGERHLRCFGRTGRAELSFCEINDELRQRIAGQYDVERTYDQLSTALADPHDAIVICAPANLHIPMAIEAAEAGLHTLIEKPLSTSLDDVERLGRMLSFRELVAAVAYTYRAYPVMQAVKAAIDGGRFGSPRHITAVCGQHFPTGRPAYRDIYYADRGTGGGAIQDALTHLLNAGEYLVGPIDELTADAAHQVLEGVEVEDTVNAITRHGQVLGCYSLNQFQAPNEVAFTIACDRGTIYISFLEYRWKWMSEPNGTWHEEPPLLIERDDAFVIQAEAFLDAIEGKSKPLCTFAEGVQTLKVNLAALRAADGHTWETIQR